MTYCIECRKPTNDIKVVLPHNKQYNIINASCTICNTFKHQYMKEIPCKKHPGKKI